MLCCLLKVFLEWCVSVGEGVLKARLLFCSHASIYALGLPDTQVLTDLLLCKEMGPNKTYLSYYYFLGIFPKSVKDVSLEEH